MSSRFSSNSEGFASELLETIEECFLGITYIMIVSVCSYLQPHNSVSPVPIELMYICHGLNIERRPRNLKRYWAYYWATGVLYILILWVFNFDMPFLLYLAK